MVEYSPDQLDHLFRALADTTRREMLRQLAAGEQTVSQLAEPHAMSFAAAAKHVRKLEDAGLVSSERSGREAVFTVEPEGFARSRELLELISKQWDQTLDRLRAFVE